MKNYELLDIGAMEKLEKINGFVLRRPEKKALGPKTLLKEWDSPDATYSEQYKTWVLGPNVPENFDLDWTFLKFRIRLAQSKQIGIFPEQETHWNTISSSLKNTKGLKFLNLFGYSGASSIVAVRNGAEVTHVEAASSALELLTENEKLNNVEGKIRIIKDDCLKFLQREVKRGNKYDIIISDPTAVGRFKDTTFSLEHDLEELIDLISQVTSPDAKLVILNIYSGVFDKRKISQLLEEKIKMADSVFKFDDLVLKTESGKELNTGCYFQFSKN